MKKLLQCSAAVLAACMLAGCSASRADTPVVEAPEPAAIYKAGHGLRLTASAREFVGLETGEVASNEGADGQTVLTIPAGALVRAVRGDFVFVENGGWLLLTPVMAGAVLDGRVEIREGLYEGDIVATRGVRMLVLAEIQALNGGVGCADGH